MKNKKIKTKFGKKDIKRINTAFYNKVEEYSKLTLNELKALYPTLGGAYKEACIQVAEVKLRELREANFKELTYNENNVQETTEDVEIIEILDEISKFPSVPGADGAVNSMKDELPS